MNEQVNLVETQDSKADAIAAVILVVTFVATCVFWVAGQ